MSNFNELEAKIKLAKLERLEAEGERLRLACELERLHAAARRGDMCYAKAAEDAITDALRPFASMVDELENTLPQRLASEADDPLALVHKAFDKLRAMLDGARVTIPTTIDTDAASAHDCYALRSKKRGF